MKAPIVQKFMTRLPQEMERVDNVATALSLMKKLGIHHVPVMRGLHLVGVVSERDILQARIRAGKNVDGLPIEEVCQRDVLQVNPMTPVDEVAKKMLARNADCVMVVDGEYVVGIFTSTDALNILTSLFGKAKGCRD